MGMRILRKTIGFSFTTALLGLALAFPAVATEWPQEIPLTAGAVTIYQPQPESITRDTMTARAALSIQFDNVEEPEFGVAWFSARVTTDRAENLATFTEIRIDRVSWPDSKDTQEQSLTQQVERAFADTAVHMALSDMTASLAANQKAHDSLADIDNTPPRILFREALSVLLLFDGAPRFSPVDNSAYERALNTAMVVVRDTESGRVYLTNGSAWYVSNDPLGPWTPTKNPPQDLVTMISTQTEETAAAAMQVPDIVTATEPTELIVSTGVPSWTSLDGGQLLYVQNTETPWIRDLDSGNVYLQLSGRWYRASNASGPWNFVRGDKLPDSFASIPPASDIGGVRHSVAGTPEAEEAVADAQIPQTAAVNRDETTLVVNYDGKPNFLSIEGTSVAYAINTGAQVLRIDGVYYAADNGVWFTATDPQGPWTVADSVPEEKIAAIPPSAPVYNTTHVHIYQSTPSVVYVGYTPGYLWSFNYYGVPVYGTGWYYPPYIGRVYYPRTPTWGFHVGYNPWQGWNYGVSWGSPFYRAGMAWGGGWHHGYHPGRCCGGFYGGGYRHNDININTGDIHIGRNVNVGRQTLAYEHRTKERTKNNLYHNVANKSRIADQSLIHKDLKQTRNVSHKNNNLYADRKGQVARHDGDQWHIRKDKAWHPVDGQKPVRPDHDTAHLPDNVVKPHTRPAVHPDTGHQPRPAVKPSARPATRPAVHPDIGHQPRPAVKPSARPATRPALHPNTGHQSRPAVRPSVRPATRPQIRPGSSSLGNHRMPTKSFNHAHMDRHVRARQGVSTRPASTGHTIKSKARTM